MHYEVKEINDFSQFLELKLEWNSLLQESYYDIPFLRHEWFCIWWSHFGDHESRKLAVIIIRRSGKLVFAIPLMAYRANFLNFSFNILQSITNWYSFRYNFLIRKNEEGSLKIFYQYLIKRRHKWHLILLQQLPTDFYVSDLLVKEAKKYNYKTLAIHTESSPYLPIEYDWDKYYSSLKSKFRSNLRNRLKRINKLGKIDYVIAAPDNIDSAINTIFQILRKGWRGKSEDSIASNRQAKDFYLQWAKIAAENGWLRISFLTVDDQPVSFDYSVLYGNRYYCMEIGYDPDFRAYSPGQLLNTEILKRYFNDGKTTEYDFLGKLSRQKSDWAPLLRDYCWLFIYNRSFISYLHYLYRLIRHKTKTYYLKCSSHFNR